MRINPRKIYDFVFYDENWHSLNIGWNTADGSRVYSLTDILVTTKVICSNKNIDKSYRKIRYFSIYDRWEKSYEYYKVTYGFYTGFIFKKVQRHENNII